MMYEFINFLKVIATILITNAHYENIYPISIIANGGLLGDVLFFVVSGFCLSNIKGSFIKWYKKRIIRIYPTVFIVTLICIFAGLYVYENSLHGFISMFIYPTNYHFVASIIILYVFYYLILSLIKKIGINKRRGILVSMIFILIIYLIYYFFMFDKSFYHIDSVYENNIRFFFLICMLLGAWIKEKLSYYKSKKNKYNFLIIGVLFVIYFISKVLFSKVDILAPIQILNQIILFGLLYFIFITTLSYEDKLVLLPEYIRKTIKYISNLTLEIYLIQYLLIDRLNKFAFPINFIIVSFSILISAFLIKLFISQMNKKLTNIYEVRK